MKFKVAFALGGGGVRGIANIGVIRALHEAGIVPDMVAGSSMGAIVGALDRKSTRLNSSHRL